MKSGVDPWEISFEHELGSLGSGSAYLVTKTTHPSTNRLLDYFESPNQSFPYSTDWIRIWKVRIVFFKGFGAGCAWTRGWNVRCHVVGRV